MLHLKNFLPAAILSVIAGVLSGALIFVFKAAASMVFSLSSDIYSTAREMPLLLPLLICGAALAGVAASLILKAEPDARGGGIPGSIAILRGLVTFRWLRCMAATFASVMLTFLCGVPLGTEGPAVLMGTSVGRGAVSVSGERRAVLSRYIMTGGACAGFAAATGAPICGILFALEEAHRRLSPMIFFTSALSVASGMLTVEALNLFACGSSAMFHFTVSAQLSPQSLWIPAVIGLACGVLSVLFTKAHRFAGKLIDQKLSRIPFSVKLALIFAVTPVFGFFSENFIGTGHSLIDSLIEGGGAVHMLVFCILIRGGLFIVSNNAGVTGGAFIPSLALGALSGALVGGLMVRAGIMSAEYYTLAVTLGMAAFLGAVSKTPLMAIAFGIEALCGGANALAFIISTLAACFVMEVTGTHEFADTAIERKVKLFLVGKSETVLDMHMTVAAGSFADGMEIHDILLPAGCQINVIRKALCGDILSAGDVLHIMCKTHDIDESTARLREIFGG